MICVKRFGFVLIVLLVAICTLSIAFATCDETHPFKGTICVGGLCQQLERCITGDSISCANGICESVQIPQLYSQAYVWLPFDDNLNDGTANGRDAQDMHSARPSFDPITYTNGLTGKAAVLHEGVAKIDVTTLPPTFSISLWIKPETEDKEGRYPNIEEAVFEFFGDGKFVGIIQNNQFNLKIGAISAPLIPIAQVTQDQWMHIAISYDGNELRAHINGVLEHVSQRSLSRNTNNLIIGAREFHPGGDLSRPTIFADYTTFYGLVDNVAVWDRALLDSEVADLYNAHVGLSQAGPLALPPKLEPVDPVLVLHFDENSGNLAIDSSGRNNHGTLSQATREPGLHGNGIAFRNQDGSVTTSDLQHVLIKYSNDFEIDADESFTLSCWIKTSSGYSMRCLRYYQSDRSHLELSPGYKMLWSNGWYHYQSKDESGATQTKRITSQLVHDNEWHHFVITRDGINDLITMYIDGLKVLEEVDQTPGSLIAQGILTDPEVELRIGPGSGSVLFDEIKMWRRSLSHQEVVDLYNGEKPTSAAPVTVDGPTADPTCTDRIKNSDETGIDCGGSCPRCGPGNMCNVDSDCGSNFCHGGHCTVVSSHCRNGIQDIGESGIDCGQPCNPLRCDLGVSCNSNNDCLSWKCDLNTNTCVDSLCIDGKFYGENCNGNQCARVKFCVNGGFIDWVR